MYVYMYVRLHILIHTYTYICFPVPYLRRAEAAMTRGDGAAAREMLEALANALPLGPDDEYRVREMQDRLRMAGRNAPGHSAGGGPLMPARSGLGSR